MYKFVQIENNKSWYLEIRDVESLVQFCINNKSFDKDKEHLMKLRNYDNRPTTIVAHTEYGWLVSQVESMGFTVEEAYELIKNVQFNSMMKVLNEKGVIYVNKNNGFCTRKLIDSHFVYRETLEWPKYNSKDIRIKKFDDGQHYYAYIGDTQVRNGDTLKWSSYEEAYKMAEKYI